MTHKVLIIFASLFSGFGISAAAKTPTCIEKINEAKRNGTPLGELEVIDTAHISSPTVTSIMIYIELDKIKSYGQKKKIVRKNLLPYFRNLQRGPFANDRIYFMEKSNGLSFTTFAWTIERKISPVNVLIRIDLLTDLNEEKVSQIAELKKYLEPMSNKSSFSLANNHQFINNGKSADSNLAMGFINQWREDKTKEESQTHWVEQHGPCVQAVGLPDQIPTYTQIHTVLNPELGAKVFDSKYMGMSFETITGKLDLIQYFLRNPGLKNLHDTLVIDEENFTAPPLFSLFKKYDLFNE